MKKMDKEAQLFRALAHPFRLQLLTTLRGGEACVCHLCALFSKPQPYVSKQLAELRDAGLVIDRRDGLRIYYQLTDPSLGTLLDCAQLALVKMGQLSAQALLETAQPGKVIDGCECPNCQVA